MSYSHARDLAFFEKIYWCYWYLRIIRRKDVMKRNTLSWTRPDLLQWRHVNQVWRHVIPAWRHVNPTWHHVIPAWLHVIPAWRHVVPTWRHVISAWRHVDPIWHNMPCHSFRALLYTLLRIVCTRLVFFFSNRCKNFALTFHEGMSHHHEIRVNTQLLW